MDRYTDRKMDVQTYGHTNGCTDAQMCPRTLHLSAQPNGSLSSTYVSDSLFKVYFLLLNDLEKNWENLQTALGMNPHHIVLWAGQRNENEKIYAICNKHVDHEDKFIT